MQITYVGSQEDFLNAQKTHAWRKYSPTSARMQRIASPLVGCLFLYLGFRWYQRGTNSLLIAIEVVWGLYLIFAQPISTLLYRRAYKRRFGGQRHETTLTISDEAIDCVCPGRSSGTLQWSAINGAIESPSSIPIYLSPAMYLNIPKRVLSESQTEELMAMLRNKDVPMKAPKSS
jgi:hypothetical protein